MHRQLNGRAGVLKLPGITTSWEKSPAAIYDLNAGSRTRLAMCCSTSRLASKPKCSVAIWLHHSMRPCASSNTTPLGDACMAARNSSRRAWLSRNCWSRFLRSLRVRSATSPQTPGRLGAAPAIAAGVSLFCSVRSQRSRRLMKKLSITSQTIAPTAKPMPSPKLKPLTVRAQKPKPPPTIMQAAKIIHLLIMRWIVQQPPDYWQPSPSNGNRRPERFPP